METINDWYIIENKMSKGVMYFHVTITINSDFEIILEITNGNKDNLTLKFNTFFPIFFYFMLITVTYHSNRSFIPSIK